MANEHEFVNTINQLNAANKQITFAELIAQVWGGKVVEVYIGDTAEDIKFDDSTQKCVSVLIGKVITAYAECLILNCAYVEQQTKMPRFGNIVCLNERAIRTITEIDDSGILKDTFLSTRDNKIVKRLFQNVNK